MPIIVAKSFQIETFDLKSLIRPAVFDPITSNPNQVSFNINLQINRSQFELFSLHNQLLIQAAACSPLKRKLDPSSNQANEVFQVLGPDVPVLDFLHFSHVLLAADNPLT